MAKVVKDAVSGRGYAMKELYQANSRKVLYAAQKLLLNEEQAFQAAKWVWSNVWSSASKAEITQEEEFSRVALKLTADFCKKCIEEKKPQAFNSTQEEAVSTEVTEAQTANSLEDKKTERPNVDSVLAKLPELERFILVLHNVSGISNIHLATSLRMDVHTVQRILNTAIQSVEEIGKESLYSYKQLQEDMANGIKQTLVPGDVEQSAKAVMDQIAAVTEKKDKKKDNIQALLLLAAGLVVLSFVFFGDNMKQAIFDMNNTSETYYTFEDDDKESETKEPLEIHFELLDENLTYYADIEIQDYGTIVVQLDQKTAPITCGNFVDLVEKDFYDGLTFHRILKNFMMQGGDPYGNGTGGSGNPITGEFYANGYQNDISHTRGTISMARSSISNDSASSQFFIMHQDNTGLDGQYAGFGHVIEGMEIVDAICEAAQPIDNNGMIDGEAQPIITNITIRTEAASTATE